MTGSGGHRRASYWARITARTLEISLVLVVVLLLAALGRQLLTIGWGVMGHDGELYLDVARQVAGGSIPYRDFSFEYPPLALLPIVVPVLAWLPGGLDLAGYSALLAAENLVLVAATGACLAWLARRGWSAQGVVATVATYGLLVAATPILFWRFDAFAALLTALALYAAASGRSGWAGLGLGAGTLVKLYPLALVPALGLADVAPGRRAALLRLVAGASITILLGVLVLVLAAGADGLSFLGYQAARGVQLESLPASVGLLAFALGGPPVQVFTGYGAWQLESPFVDSLGWLWPSLVVLMLVALVLSAVARYRADHLEYGRVTPQTQVVHLLATLLVVLLSYRVLSPQYLVWLLPVAALLPRAQALTVAAICALTLYLFPFGYEALVDLQSSGIAALVVRNALLVVVFVWLVTPGVWLALSRVGLWLRGRRALPADG
jgi:hypothetical protein